MAVGTNHNQILDFCFFSLHHCRYRLDVMRFNIVFSKLTVYLFKIKSANLAKNPAMLTLVFFFCFFAQCRISLPGNMLAKTPPAFRIAAVILREINADIVERKIHQSPNTLLLFTPYTE